MSALRRLGAALGWTRHSSALLGGFLLTLFIIGYVWWPLAAEYLATFNPHYPWWVQVDWLLVGDFLAMSLLIMAGADLRADLRIVGVGLIGGLVIEAWGTQTNLWHYYTLERPPLWIVPAWPIASLAIDRIYRRLDRLVPAGGWRTLGASVPRLSSAVYGLVFLGFYALLLAFVWPTLDKPLTLGALAVCALLLLDLARTAAGRRAALLIFAAGSGLGYFLELWGTTRACWTYYTLETPPLFAVLAHGLAAVAFWRAGQLLAAFGPRRLGLQPLSRGDAEQP